MIAVALTLALYEIGARYIKFNYISILYNYICRSRHTTHVFICLSLPNTTRHDTPECGGSSKPSLLLPSRHMQCTWPLA